MRPESVILDTLLKQFGYFRASKHDDLFRTLRTEMLVDGTLNLTVLDILEARYEVCSYSDEAILFYTCFGVLYNNTVNNLLKGKKGQDFIASSYTYRSANVLDYKSATVFNNLISSVECTSKLLKFTKRVAAPIYKRSLRCSK